MSSNDEEYAGGQPPLTATAPRPAADRAGPRRSTIMIVDDDTYTQLALQQLLQHEGHELISVMRGDEALRIAGERLPELILLDVMMPGLDGFEVCERLRANPQTREIAILLITSLNDQHARLQGLGAGADGFIAKPFDRAELLAQVRTITRLQRYRRLLDEQSRFARLTDLSPDGIAAIAGDGSLSLANPALARMLGLESPDQLIARPFESLLAADSVDRFRSGAKLLSSGAQPSVQIEVSLCAEDGRLCPVELNLGLLPAIEGATIQVIVRDIRLRKQAEAQIQRQISQLTSLHAIGVAITASLNLETTLSVLIERMAEHLHIDAVSVLLFDQQTERLRSAGSRGCEQVPNEPLVVSRGDSMAAIVFLTRRPLVVARLSQEEPRGPRDQALHRHFAAYIAMPLASRDRALGVVEVLHRAPFAPDNAWWAFFEALCVQAAIALDTAELFAQIQQAHLDLTHSYNATIEGWSRALDLRDHETEGHSTRVTEMAIQLARRMRLSAEEVEHIRRGALLHDIGKMGVPDRILLKPGPLTPDEWQVMRQHPIYAYQWLSEIPFLHPALSIPYAHHERWDGSGYPRGLRGEQIPLAARIFAIVDVWDALRSQRPYRTPWPREQVIAHIQSLSGSHFDPRVVETFLGMMYEQDGAERSTPDG